MVSKDGKVRWGSEDRDNSKDNSNREAAVPHSNAAVVVETGVGCMDIGRSVEET